MNSIYLIHRATTVLHIFIWRAGTESGYCHTNTCNSPALWVPVPLFPVMGETDTVPIESLKRFHAVDVILSNCKLIIDANLKIIGINFNATPFTYILLIQYCIKLSILMVKLYSTKQFPLDIYTFSDNAATAVCVIYFITVQCFEFGGLHLYYITSGKTFC